MKIIHHERKRLASHFSIERLFAEIRRSMPADCEVTSCPAPEASAGVIPRIRNVRHAARKRADVHHIVGDSHYLAFGLPPDKTVLTIHDCGALNRLKGVKRALLKYFWFTGPMRRAAVVTTISQASKDELRKWVGHLADKVVVVPDCVFEEFAYDPKPFNDERPVVLQVGTKWNKNVERVMEAVRGTRCRLEIVGTLGRDQETKGLKDQRTKGLRDDWTKGLSNQETEQSGYRGGHEPMDKGAKGPKDEKARGEETGDRGRGTRGDRHTADGIQHEGREKAQEGEGAGGSGGSVGRCCGASEETRHEEESAYASAAAKDYGVTRAEDDLRLINLKLKTTAGLPVVCELGRLTDEELVQAYRRCDMVVFASLYEGFGLPILEAQAMGRPVITSNFGAMREAAGGGALLVDPYSVEAIREAVLRITREPALREDLIAKGRENAERFRAEAVAARYGELYRNLATD